MSGALLSFSAMALGIRNLSGTFTTFEILALRTGSGLVVMLVIGALQPHFFRSFTTHRIWLHATRNSIHLASQYLWTASIALLPLATVFALEFTTPAWTTLLAVALLGERLTASRIGAIAVAFGGLSSHYCLTKALNAGDASIVIPFDFLRLPLIALLAFLIYGEPIDPLVFAGGALIIAGVIWNLRGEAVFLRRPAAAK